jgi:molybdopterin/thiamine biosynthesis adenylyltransferase
MAQVDKMDTWADDLYRSTDVGKSKALVASEFVMNRVPGVKITPLVWTD